MAGWQGNSVIKFIMWPFISCSGSLATISYLCKLSEDKDYQEGEQELSLFLVESH